MNMLVNLFFALLACILNVSFSAAIAADNPCDGGEIFSLICKMLTVMKKDIENGNKALDAKFNVLLDVQQNASREMKENIRQESKRISQKQANDVKMLEKMIEEKIKGTSSILRYKIDKNRNETDLKIKALITRSDLVNVEKNLNKRINENILTQRQEVEKLEKEIEDDKNELKNEIRLEKLNVAENLNKKIDETKKHCQTSIASLQNALAQQIQQSKQQIQDLYSKYDEIRVSKWPSGSYCILQNGKCPAGFKSIQGWLRAINQFAASGSYVKVAHFGNSSIKCHGNCGQYGNWIGEITLTTCCK